MPMLAQGPGGELMLEVVTSSNGLYDESEDKAVLGSISSNPGNINLATSSLPISISLGKANNDPSERTQSAGGGTIEKKS